MINESDDEMMESFCRAALSFFILSSPLPFALLSSAANERRHGVVDELGRRVQEGLHQGQPAGARRPGVQEVGLVEQDKAERDGQCSAVDARLKLGRGSSSDDWGENDD